MPLFDFKCNKCGIVVERYLYVSEAGTNELPCDACGGVLSKQFPIVYAQQFKPQFLRDLQHNAPFVRTKQEMRDAIRRFNNSELADKQGTISARDYSNVREV